MRNIRFSRMFRYLFCILKCGSSINKQAIAVVQNYLNVGFCYFRFSLSKTKSVELHITKEKIIIFVTVRLFSADRYLCKNSHFYHSIRYL